MLIDATRPYRRPADRRALIEAILALPAGAQETDWLEWKSTLDLTSKEDRAKLAKHIVAFANRMPAAAAQHCGGYAYIVVGAEPQRLHGIEIVDSANLDQGLEPYLGTGEDAPLWALEWVSIDGTYVLVIEVAAPQPGTTIYPSRREFAGVIRADTAYVRRRGRSVPATWQELQALAERRAASEAEAALSVVLEADRPDSMMVPRFRWDEATDKAIVQEARDEAAGWRRVMGVAGLLDDRPTKQQLGDYANELDDVATVRAVSLACQIPGARVDLIVHNVTDRPFQGLRLEVRTRGAVVVADYEIPDLPTEPAGGYEGLPAALLALQAPDAVADLLVDPDIRYADGKEVVVMFDPIDLRPGTMHRFPPFWMLAIDLEDEPAPNALELEWRAAAMNANGALSATLSLPIADELTAISGLRD